MSWQRTCALGGALFAMLFGAGNIIFPLILGRSLGSSITYAMIGFFMTGVGIPLIGFVSVMISQGDYGLFLGKFGRIPGFLIAILCMSLLGPLGAIPRCIAIAHADLSWYVPELPAWLFSIVAGGVIWLCTFRKNNVMDLITRFLAPIKIMCLLAIVVLGLMNIDTPPFTSEIEPIDSFFKGIKGGYGTMDLLAVLFFCHMIYQKVVQDSTIVNKRSIMRQSFAISLVTGLLLTTVYVGFAWIAASYGTKILHVADDTLLSALASLILGPRAGLFVNITIALTCLTTAIALTASFADFLSRYVLNNRISYRTAVTITVIASALLANLKLMGIMNLIMPLITMIYPVLTGFACLQLFFLFCRKEV